MKLGALPEPMYHGGPGHGHSHQEVPAGPTLDLILELNGEWHAHEIDAGVKDPNSGGNTVYLSPGLRLSMDKWSGFVSVGIPIVNHSNGFQSEADVQVFSGIAVTF